MSDFDAITFYKEYEAIIDGRREEKCESDAEDFLKARQAEEHKSTAEIYKEISSRIKGACDHLKGEPPRGESDDHKKKILRKYFPQPIEESGKQKANQSRPLIHVIQGPPGTGKTEISALYILLYLLEWHVKNKKKPDNQKSFPKIGVSAFTHKAIENVLLRVERLFPLFYALALKKGHIGECPRADSAASSSDECKNCCFPFARMLKVHPSSFSRRSMFKGSKEDSMEEVSDFAPNLVFGNREGGPVDDRDKPLGIHDLRLNPGELSWFLKDEKGGEAEDNPNGLLGNIQGFDRPTIIGSTTSQFIGGKASIGKVDFLLLDEASMMMLPDFLPLANQVKEGGHLLVVGDDLQLGPISQNDWSREIRPSLNEYKPWNSVFHYLRRMANPEPKDEDDFACKGGNGKVAWSALKKTYRLTAEATELIQPAYERADIKLEAPRSRANFKHLKVNQDRDLKQQILPSDYGEEDNLSAVTLISYDEHFNDTSNQHEVDIIKSLLKQYLKDAAAESTPQESDGTAGDASQGANAANTLKILSENPYLIPDGVKNSKSKQSIAIVTPYHDQIKAIKTRIKDIFEGGELPDWLLVDTVNKLQGDERDIIIFSASVSGEENLAAHGSFVMELQRTNVAFSRAKKHLIVIASESLLNYIPHNFQEYQAALLWKNLRDLCQK